MLTRDDLIRMALEVGIEFALAPMAMVTQSELQRFASLVASEEREACAIAYENEADSWYAWPQAGAAKRRGAKAIRYRNNQGNQQ